ncbi:Methyltransferase domain-containing protein [Candidatus Kryptonium thompsonii]|uniref:Methyltransferase domain-containing protein n=1 Tax=Candidatus Kryptonium thompsonii TaxID=1633631 RepID=A0A0P1LYD6_9BACT|nr:methyltransferase domain-containing protein [Candidatus Kryptonium thompsoni]CUS77514.1 Methyltransferase domain-containing protein [Candidatus Kryptonium thompsoni]CUS86173.1 Methyltransferase domain-containing protein [Candidatus Kryptonium thompsoni]CUS90890.1 Methyltransferase domain-containing protein [Candidatus Kryptonium thompsoni]CUS93354.1 Methyltransferase domain-containing protein [Candidatus Kryptonium thompsoni]CUT02624.1 Methyltransferase domain-containing protein [Candidatus
MHKFNPEHGSRLLSEERRKILPPEEILKSCGLEEGMTMVDVGCGNGYFTIPASKIVGDKGKIYAIDIQEEMINQLKLNDLPENVIPILAKSEHKFPLEDKISDFTFLAFVTHENENIEMFLDEIKRITKDNGRIVILEWKKQHEEMGPPYEERISQDELISLLKKVGLSIIEYADVNQSHYKIVCVKK